MTLDGKLYFPDRPIVLPDPESEALATGVDSRARIQSDTLTLPDSLRELLQSGLTADPKKGRKETGAAWELVRKDFGFSALASWYERAESQAKASIFLAPSPVVRGTSASVRRAFDFGWQIVDSIETAFDAVGVHLLLHAEILSDDVNSIEARGTFVSCLIALYRDPNPRNFPVISIKILDPSKSLSSGPEASIRRRNLGELLLRASEAIHQAGGLAVVHNFGTWVLGPLDCGVDIVGFRGTGRTLDLDLIYSTPDYATSNRTKPSVAPPLVAPKRKQRIQPFDPVRLSDARLSEVKALWKKSQAFPVAKHVEPEPFWTWDKLRQREFRTLQVTAALLELGEEFRSAGKGTIPIRDCIRDRVERMQEHDAMFDLCPSL
jgi:hypothetical protein